MKTISTIFPAITTGHEKKKPPEHLRLRWLHFTTQGVPDEREPVSKQTVCGMNQTCGRLRHVPPPSKTGNPGPA